MPTRLRLSPLPLWERSTGQRPVGRGVGRTRRHLRLGDGPPPPPLPNPPPQGGREQTEATTKKVAKIHDKSGPEWILFSEKFACPVSGFTIPEIEPRLFSFNNPYGP